MLNILRRHLLQERLDKRGCHRIDNPDFSERFRKNESGLAVTPEENSHERLQTEELQIGPKFDAAKERRDSIEIVRGYHPQLLREREFPP